MKVAMRILAVLAVCVVGVAAHVGMVTAQVTQPGDGPRTSGQALEISPALVTLDVDPGESRVLEIQLRNISSEDLLVSGEINDFVASSEGGAPRILLEEDEEEQEANPYSFRDWAESLTPLLLEPNDIQTLSVTINVPENASPGGYYGAVRFTGSPPEFEDTGVSLAASIGTLVLITVSGDFVTEVEIEEFFTTNDEEPMGLFESTPFKLVQRIRNTGNVHTQTTGRVFIKDMFGRDVAAANVNLARHNILPDSIRRFEQDIDSSLIGNKRLFGRYTADLQLTYGDEQTVSDSLVFWVIPYRLIAIIIVLLVIVFLGVQYSLKRYKRRILSQARRGRY